MTVVEKLQDEYIELLGKEISDLMSFATPHGWKSKRVENGAEMRNLIEASKKESMKADMENNEMN